MKVQKKWISQAYLDTSTVVRHPRGQGNQHCKSGTKKILDLTVKKNLVKMWNWSTFVYKRQQLDA